MTTMDNGLVSTRDQNLLAEIERDALDERVSLTTILRKCVMLGAKIQNTNLEDWASQELGGYRDDDAKIPTYRTIYAPLSINVMTATHRGTGIPIGWSHIPEVAREHITEELKLAQSVGDLQAMVTNGHRNGKSTVQLMPFGAADLVKIMNHKRQDPAFVVTELYWNVSLSSIEGVLGEIRTTLVRLVSELQASMPANMPLPSSEPPARSITVVLQDSNGNQVNVMTAQADNGATATLTPPSNQHESSWTKMSTVWTILGVIAGVASAYFAYRQWRGQ